LLFNHREDGRTAADAWEAEGWTGLDNDERIMMRYRRHTLPTIVEIERVLDDHALRCRDVLESERGAFVVFDRRLAPHALPYGRMLVALVHYPHFGRFNGVGIEIDMEIMDEFLRALHKRADSKGDSSVLKRWLAEHFRDGHEILRAVAMDHRKRMMAKETTDARST
jgi:hypothetical protein